MYSGRGFDMLYYPSTGSGGASGCIQGAAQGAGSITNMLLNTRQAITYGSSRTVERKPRGTKRSA
jgi:hypothetical protein